MIRFIKASVLTLLLAMSLNVNYFASVKVFESGGCRGSLVNSITRENIFLNTSSATPTFAAKVFEGCWTSSGNFPCYAIYSNRGRYQICGQCDSSGNPGSGGCSNISLAALNNGLWCS